MHFDAKGDAKIASMKTPHSKDARSIKAGSAVPGSIATKSRMIDPMHEEKLRLIYHQSWPSVWFSIAASILLWVTLQGMIDGSVLNRWLFVHILASGVRILLYYKFRRAITEKASLKKWELPFFITLMITVSIWSFGGVLFATMSTDEYKLAIYLFLLGLAAGAVPAYYPFRYIAISVICMELVPISIYFMVSPSHLHKILAATCTLFLISAYRATRLQASTLEDNFQLNAELRQRNEEISKTARTDYLTGLLNRRSFVETCEPHINYGRRYAMPVSLLIIDLDHFKKINDRFGHPAGDKVLQRAAAIIRSNCRDSDICARFGGEEFAVLLPSTDIAGAMVAAEKIRMAVHDVKVSSEGERIPVSASVGVATGALPLEKMIAAADTALYRAKSDGRNCIRHSSY